ncbi:TPA: hypothetical protein R1815_001621 [Campylobacter jejuni]|nr:hypothetical protein [Campylobacter jejuni]HEC1932183.1 hypothetical protein [Campylobacter jejuni]
MAVTGNVDDENYVLTIEHSWESNYYGGDYDEYCKVKDFASCNYEIELFTGLYDKKGNKIYENDIIKNEPLEEIYHITRDDTNKMFKIIMYNEYSNGKFYRRKAEPDISFLKSFKSEKNMEVIGNIHENADLLEVKE